MKFRRPSGALIASILVNAVIVFVFTQAIMFQRPIWDFFGWEQKSVELPPPERIGFLVYPSGPVGGSPTPAPERGPPSPVVAPPPPQVIAPTTIPTEVPKAPEKPEQPPKPSGPTTGPMVGGQGNLKGVQPRYEDPRVWTQPGAVATAPTIPKTGAQKLDSVIAEILGQQKDSLKAVAAGQRAPGDWTFEKGGKKYGVDGRFIRLGPVAIPTAVLALLPLNVTANPTATERERRNAAAREEIGMQAQRRINEADFQKAVKAIRERKERERREQEKEKEKNKAADKSTASDPEDSQRDR